jgi:hypothetical protein
VRDETDVSIVIGYVEKASVWAKILSTPSRWFSSQTKEEVKRLVSRAPGERRDHNGRMRA